MIESSFTEYTSSSFQQPNILSFFTTMPRTIFFSSSYIVPPLQKLSWHTGQGGTLQASRTPAPPSASEAFRCHRNKCKTLPFHYWGNHVLHVFLSQWSKTHTTSHYLLFFQPRLYDTVQPMQRSIYRRDETSSQRPIWWAQTRKRKSHHATTHWSTNPPFQITILLLPILWTTQNSFLWNSSLQIEMLFARQEMHLSSPRSRFHEPFGLDERDEILIFFNFFFYVSI